MFVEVNYHQKQKEKNEICGDVFLSQKIKAENRTIIVLADGLGAGIKANILASMTASMALNFVKANSPIEHTAKIIMSTLPVDSFRKISYCSFTILDIVGNNIKLIEYGNPGAFIWKDGRFFEPRKKEIGIPNHKVKQVLYTAELTINQFDRIILVTDGITQSGIGGINTPFGWGRDDVKNYVHALLDENQNTLAEDMAGKIITQAVKHDTYAAKDDMTCGVVYFREPRKVLFCTGPPYNELNDNFLAREIDAFSGRKIISGGTTAQIVSRELQREINVNISSVVPGLPPDSEMAGIDLVTEGILTLGKVSEFLQSLPQLNSDLKGPAGKIIKLFHENDEIIFLTGTRVNEAHQDPTLPVELEIRRNVVKKIADLLESKFLKKVEIKYI